MRPRLGWLAGPVGGLLVGLILAACGSGGDTSGVSIHTGIASSAEGAISIEADGWTYAVPLDGVMWTDRLGTWHDSGRPDCLPPGGAAKPVTFAAVSVTVKGSSWRPVVWVQCD